MFSSSKDIKVFAIEQRISPRSKVEVLRNNTLVKKPTCERVVCFSAETNLVADAKYLSA